MSKKILKILDFAAENVKDVITWLKNQETCEFNCLIVSEAPIDVLTQLQKVGEEKKVKIIVDVLLHELPTYRLKTKHFNLSSKDFYDVPFFSFSWKSRSYKLRHTTEAVKYISHRLKELRNIGISKFVVKKSTTMDKQLLGAILTQDGLNTEYTLYEDNFMANVEDITRSLYYIIKPEPALIKIMRTIDKPDFTHKSFNHKNEFFVDVIGTHVIFDNQSKFDYKVHSKFPELNLPFTTIYTTNIDGLAIVEGNIESVHKIRPSEKA